MNEYIASIASYFRKTFYEQSVEELDILIFDTYIKELAYKLVSYRVNSLSIMTKSDYDYLKDLINGRTTTTEEKLKEKNEILPDLYLIMKVISSINKTDYDVLMHCLDPSIN